MDGWMTVCVGDSRTASSLKTHFEQPCFTLNIQTSHIRYRTLSYKYIKNQHQAFEWLVHVSIPSFAQSRHPGRNSILPCLSQFQSIECPSERKSDRIGVPNSKGQIFQGALVVRTFLASAFSKRHL